MHIHRRRISSFLVVSLAFILFPQSAPPQTQIDSVSLAWGGTWSALPKNHVLFSYYRDPDSNPPFIVVDVFASVDLSQTAYIGQLGFSSSANPATIWSEIKAQLGDSANAYHADFAIGWEGSQALDCDLPEKYGMQPYYMANRFLAGEWGGQAGDYKFRSIRNEADPNHVWLHGVNRYLLDQTAGSPRAAQNPAVERSSLFPTRDSGVAFGPCDTGLNGQIAVMDLKRIYLNNLLYWIDAPSCSGSPVNGAFFDGQGRLNIPGLQTWTLSSTVSRQVFPANGIFQYNPQSQGSRVYSTSLGRVGLTDFDESFAFSGSTRYTIAHHAKDESSSYGDGAIFVKFAADTSTSFSTPVDAPFASGGYGTYLPESYPSWGMSYGTLGTGFGSAYDLKSLAITWTNIDEEPLLHLLHCVRNANGSYSLIHREYFLESDRSYSLVSSYKISSGAPYPFAGLDLTYRTLSDGTIEWAYVFRYMNDRFAGGGTYGTYYVLTRTASEVTNYAAWDDETGGYLDALDRSYFSPVFHKQSDGLILVGLWLNDIDVRMVAIQ